ncbi:MULTISPECIES: hypothetical protein [unclassified Bradyrhizobium]|uniref:hypothetical protein n=1 Tax=unclassified Bradyrhizobium TaxID=2631580 RepID=UPI00247A880B|nr:MULTISPECIES: hypothetical protein [unclassified Bradyrhizobium]WGR73923.1 hypothetical protein MTX24_14375 [Bradyrhizobium sp. ISRA426]WGR78760.1 hypothetical protein MTX21_39345 [Bradyrhizobium sp. ISRA430]WGR89162.1 hypothetical protein MTX25_14390 [Bradyrhizobium sp. ISRA432]
MRGRDAVRLVVCAAALALAFDARAEDQFRMLDGKQIRARVVGQDITDGPHWSMYLRPDGALISSESGSSWTGNWKIRDDKLCMTMPSSPSLVCNEVWMSGPYIRMHANKDGETFDARVMAHPAKQ